MIHLNKQEIEIFNQNILKFQNESSNFGSKNNSFPSKSRIPLSFISSKLRQDKIFIEQFECYTAEDLLQQRTCWIDLYNTCFDIIIKDLHFYLQTKVKYTKNPQNSFKPYQEPQSAYFEELAFFKDKSINQNYLEIDGLIEQLNYLNYEESPDLSYAEELAEKFRREPTQEEIDLYKKFVEDLTEETSFNLGKNVCEQIIFKSLNGNWLNQQQFEFFPLLQSLTRVQGLNSVFELLNIERQKMLFEYQKVDTMLSGDLAASHQWQFDKLDRNMIKTNEPFITNNAVWKLGVTYNRQKDATLKVNLNLVVNPFQDKKSKLYYKKNEFFLASNYNQKGQGNDLQLLLPHDFEDRDQSEKEQYLQMKQRIENTIKGYPSHSFVSFLAAAKVNDEKYQQPVLTSLIVSNKSPAIISKIKCFMIEDYIEFEQETGKRFTLSVFIKVNPLLSVILATLSSNFCHILADPAIGFLQPEDFKLLLKHKRFNVTSEDEVMLAISLWSMDPKISQDQISTLIADINWNYVSLPCLLDVTKNCSKLRENLDFKDYFQKEMSFRANFQSSKISQLTEPRFSYKFTKISSDQFQLRSDRSNRLPQDALLEMEDVSEMKKRMIENNYNYLQELNYNWLYPLDVFNFYLSQGDQEQKIKSKEQILIIEQQTNDFYIQNLLQKEPYNSQQAEQLSRQLLEQLVIKDKLIEKIQFKLKKVNDKFQTPLKNLIPQKIILEKIDNEKEQFQLLQIQLEKQQKQNQLQQLQITFIEQQQKILAQQQQENQIKELEKKQLNQMGKGVQTESIRFEIKEKVKPVVQRIKKVTQQIKKREKKEKVQTKNVQKQFYNFGNIFNPKKNICVQTDSKQFMQDVGISCNLLSETILQVKDQIIDDLGQQINALKIEIKHPGTNYEQDKYLDQSIPQFNRSFLLNNEYTQALLGLGQINQNEYHESNQIRKRNTEEDNLIDEVSRVKEPPAHNLHQYLYRESLNLPDEAMADVNFSYFKNDDSFCLPNKNEMNNLNNNETNIKQIQEQLREKYQSQTLDQSNSIKNSQLPFSELQQTNQQKVPQLQIPNQTEPSQNNLLPKPLRAISNTYRPNQTQKSLKSLLHPSNTSKNFLDYQSSIQNFKQHKNPIQNYNFIKTQDVGELAIQFQELRKLKEDVQKIGQELLYDRFLENIEEQAENELANQDNNTQQVSKKSGMNISSNRSSYWSQQRLKTLIENKNKGQEIEPKKQQKIAKYLNQSSQQIQIKGKLLQEIGKQKKHEGSVQSQASGGYQQFVNNSILSNKLVNMNLNIKSKGQIKNEVVNQVQCSSGQSNIKIHNQGQFFVSDINSVNHSQKDGHGQFQKKPLYVKKTNDIPQQPGKLDIHKKYQKLSENNIFNVGSGSSEYSYESEEKNQVQPNLPILSISPGSNTLLQAQQNTINNSEVLSINSPNLKQNQDMNYSVEIVSGNILSSKSTIQKHESHSIIEFQQINTYSEQQIRLEQQQILKQIQDNKEFYLRNVNKN